MNQPRSLQAEIDDFFTQPAAEGATLASGRAASRFSPFRPADAMRANDLADEFGALADAAADRREGLARVIDRAQSIRPENPRLVDFALGLFITHHPRARGLEVTPLELREPRAVLPSVPPEGAGLLTPAPGREPELAWFREDAKANEHHEHWHWVFRNFPQEGLRLKDRHGEMFFYMHQQMLARYDAERRALGIDPAAAFDRYDAVIGEAYDPAPGFEESPGPGLERWFSPRQEGMAIDNDAHREEMEHYRTLLGEVIARGTFEDGTPVDSDTLGMAVEPAAGLLHEGHPSPVDTGRYGWLHGAGHVGIAGIAGGSGVMADTATAIRDPIFWRWHRHVDDFNFQWQETQAAHDFAADVPEGVRVRDVILAFKDRIPGLTDRASGERFGSEAFGGSAWEADFSGGGEHGTDVLETMMCVRPLTGRDGEPLANEFGDPYTLPYLDHRPFVYFFRLENQAAEPREVTVRVWIAPAEATEDRRAWIEMDKFRYTLQPGERAVVYRPAQEASVIRKPAQKPPVSFIDMPSDPDDVPDDEENYCTCGWPYNLLLPRGTPEGAAYRLLVVATDYAGDRVVPRNPAGRTCGSVSFCGLRDDRYPDSKAMGYPFHRPFAGRIADTLAAHPSMAVRDFTIRHVPAQGDPPQYREEALA